MSSVRSSNQSLSQPGVQGSSTFGKIDQPLSKTSISLQKVLGSTTLSPAGFDYCSGGSCFALCAGSAAVVSCVGENLEISQKIFRTDARVQLPGGTKSFSDSPKHNIVPEVRNHSPGSSRSTRNGRKSSLSASSDQETLPSKANIRGKTRVVSCVALSEDGRLLAVGEVRWSTYALTFLSLILADWIQSTHIDILHGLWKCYRPTCMSSRSHLRCSLPRVFTGLPLAC